MTTTPRGHARIIVSDWLPVSQTLKRLQWLWSRPATQRTRAEQTLWLRRVATIDAGFPLRRQDLEQGWSLFPALLTIQPTAICRPDAGCPICRTETSCDPIQVTACGHVFCYRCLQEWSIFQADQLSCPLCRCSLALDPGQFQRLLAPPHVPVSPPRYWHGSDVTLDAVRDRFLREQLTLTTPLVVISEWAHTAQRFGPAGPHVTFCTLQHAQQQPQPHWQRLVVFDTLDAEAAVHSFLTGWPGVTQRWYLATRWSVDHYLLSTAPKPLVLDQYAEFLATQLSLEAR